MLEGPLADFKCGGTKGENWSAKKKNTGMVHLPCGVCTAKDWTPGWLTSQPCRKLPLNHRDTCMHARARADTHTHRAQSTEMMQDTEKDL